MTSKRESGSTPSYRIPMTKKKARKNAAYQMLYDAAKERILGDNARGFFSKDELLETTNLVGLEVYWLILRDILEEDTGLDLYPVSAAYFKRRKHDDDPGKYLCQGHGKKCAGYIVACPENGPALKRILKMRQRQLEGGAEAFEKQATHAEAHVDELLTGRAPLQIPQIHDDRSPTTPRLA